MLNLKLTSLILFVGVVFCGNIFANPNPNGEEDSADFTIVVKDNSVIFDVLENDKVTGDVLDFGLDNKPAYGEVKINEDKSITYIPTAGLCDKVDEFAYYYEDGKGKHTINVYVEILCENLTVISGFNPAGGENPNTFTILGVENYPDNTLYIFNNDGNEIYYKEGYTNDWTGTQGGETLPNDYVYYYVFNDGKGNMISGYLQIN